MAARIRYDEPQEANFASRFWSGWGLALVLVCAVGLGVVARAVMLALAPRAKPVIRQPIAPPPTPPEPPERTIFAMEETVRVGRTEWTILEARDLGTELKSNNMWVKNIRGDGTRFISIEGRVVNRSEDTVSLKKLVLTAHDPDGKEFLETPDVGFYLPYWLERLAPRRLRPGVVETFGAIFEVPVETAGLRFKVLDLAAPKEQALSKLVDVTPEPEAGDEKTPVGGTPAPDDGEKAPEPAPATDPAREKEPAKTQPAPKEGDQTPVKTAPSGVTKTDKP
jgi:hypothetical protein